MKERTEVQKTFIKINEALYHTVIQVSVIEEQSRLSRPVFQVICWIIKLSQMHSQASLEPLNRAVLYIQIRFRTATIFVSFSNKGEITAGDYVSMNPLLYYQ